MNSPTNDHLLQWRYWFGHVDSRPVAFYRILLALILLKDAIYHIPLAGWFYSDAGVLPRRVLFDGLACCDRFSLMDSLEHEWQAVLFFIIWIVVLLGLLMGYRTRTMAILNFILILSVHERNTFVINGADNVLRLMSFWLMFAPAGQHYAVDAIRRKQLLSPQIALPTTMFALPLRLLQWQVILVYAFTAYFKIIGDSWHSGDAMFYILQLDDLLIPPGRWLRDLGWNWLYQLITWYTLALEGALPFLLLSPFWQPKLRRIGLIGGILLHIGIALTMAIPDFSIVMMSSYVLFVEPDLVDQFWQYLKRHAARLQNFITPPIQHFYQWLVESAAIPPDKTNLRTRQIQTVILMPLIMMVIWWNIEITWQYQEHPLPPPPPLINDIIHYLGLWQSWDLFAPTPYMLNGQFVIEGYFSDDTTLNLKTGRPLQENTTPPKFGPGLRQVKFEEVMYGSVYDQLLASWADYYCKQYNQPNQRPRLKSLQIQFVYRRSHAPDQPRNGTTLENLWDQSCD